MLNASPRWGMIISICWAGIRSRSLRRSVREPSIRCVSWKKQSKRKPKSRLQKRLRRLKKTPAHSMLSSLRVMALAGNMSLSVLSAASVLSPFTTYRPCGSSEKKGSWHFRQETRQILLFAIGADGCLDEAGDRTRALGLRGEKSLQSCGCGQYAYRRKVARKDGAVLVWEDG